MPRCMWAKEGQERLCISSSLEFKGKQSNRDRSEKILREREGSAAGPGQLHPSPKPSPTSCAQSTFQGLLACVHLDGLFRFAFFFFGLVHKKFSHFYYPKFSPVMTNPGLCRGTSHCNFGWDYASTQGQRAARRDGVPPGPTDPSKPLLCQIIVPKLPLSLLSCAPALHRQERFLRAQNSRPASVAAGTLRKVRSPPPAPVYPPIK